MGCERARREVQLARHAAHVVTCVWRDGRVRHVRLPCALCQISARVRVLRTVGGIFGRRVRELGVCLCVCVLGGMHAREMPACEIGG